MVHITAHSGCDGTPDNSLEFVRHALTTGADALEVDVRKTEDGSLAISHDAIPAGEAHPLLAEVFSLIRESDIRINCDLKEPDLENAVIDLAEKHGLLRRLIFSGSVGLPFVASRPDIHDRVEIYINLEELLPDLYERIRKELPLTPEEQSKLVVGQVPYAAALCREYGFRVINIYYEYCSPAFLQEIAREGLRISAWTVNDGETAAALAQSPVMENITSRRPGIIAHALGRA